MLEFFFCCCVICCSLARCGPESREHFFLCLFRMRKETEGRKKANLWGKDKNSQILFRQLVKRKISSIRMAKQHSMHSEWQTHIVQAEKRKDQQVSCTSIHIYNIHILYQFTFTIKTMSITGEKVGRGLTTVVSQIT